MRTFFAGITRDRSFEAREAMQEQRQYYRLSLTDLENLVLAPLTRHNIAVFGRLWANSPLAAW